MSIENGIRVPKPIDSKKFEHLKKGVKPIIVCIGDYGDFSEYGQISIREQFKRQPISNHDVDYYEDPVFIRDKNFLGGGRTWTISTVDSLNKFSEKFYDCTGLIVAGNAKITGKNISFLSHQDPTQFLKTEKNKFRSHLKDRLIEIFDKCEKRTIDAVIVGGQYPSDNEYDFQHKNGRTRQNYINSIELISKEVQQVLGFEPIVVNGPKLKGSIGGFDNIYYDTQNRRLYFMRPDVNHGIGSFTSSEIEEERKKLE